jgi:hypothetical protein
MQKYPTPKEIKQMTTEELRAASAAARRDVEELWERVDEDGARNVNETFIQDVAVEIMLREYPLHFWWREQLSREDLWEEPWLPPDPVPGKAKREEGS